MIEVTENTVIDRKQELERKFFVIKNEQGKWYKNSWVEFDKYLNNAKTWNKQATAIDECKKLINYWNERDSKMKPYQKLYVVEVKFVECEND